MTKNKYIIAALCAATAMGFAQEANEMPPVVAGITTAKEYKYDVSRRYVGRVVAEESVAVVAQVAGEIKEVCFKEGDIVEKGAVLYKLDDVKYTAAVKAAEASVAQAQANFDYAKKTFDRTTVLFERKVASANDMDASVNGFNSAQAGLEAAKANLILAQDNLAHATITSPIKGRIGANTFTVGNYISLSSGVLTTVVKVDPIRVKFFLSSRDLFEMFGSAASLKENAQVKVALSTGVEYPKQGTIHFVDNTVNPQTDSIAVYVQFENADDILVAGTAVTVNVSLKNSTSYVGVPSTATIFKSTGAQMYVVKDGIAEIRDVELGPSVDGIQYVKKGIEINETVVYKGSHKVFPGAKVNGVEEK
ncbi:MAG: efflux RND transporter periplasmic adaptor subunit [Kiritimatiellae bacterium]|nr:efflux RND transporter periplasmic adaptor subunit [Kiritimatiellia bacterium]